MHKKTNKTWLSPWGFVESQIIAWGLVIVGFILNIVFGNFDFYLLSSPYNIFFGAFIIALILGSFFFRKNRFVLWFSGIHFSVSLIVALTTLCIIMGLTPQETTPLNGKDFFSILGFRSITSSWAFVIIYLFTLISLGVLIVRKKPSLKLRGWVFYLNHIGLWIVLFFSGLGYADLEKYIMYVNQGEIQWRVYDSNNQVKELPIAIELHNFTMEEHIPKLAIINRQTGKAQPESKPNYYQIDTNNKEASIDGYNIILKKYIHNAIRNSDTSFREVPMKGSCPAALVEVRDNKNVLINKGWVSCGSMAQLLMTLNIDSKLALLMTPAEPKSFISEIDVYTKESEHKKAKVEVNKPLSIGSWKVYQYGYDNQMGKLSSYSSFELVYDPWLNFVYIGIAFLALGNFLLVLFGKKYNK